MRQILTFLHNSLYHLEDNYEQGDQRLAVIQKEVSKKPRN